MKNRVVLSESLHRQLANHLLSRLRLGDLQEEACLALWRRSDGFGRYTGILSEAVLPEVGDRDLHGNVTLHGAYLNRALDRALDAQAGLAVLHSHPGLGWQALSGMDDDTERSILAPFIRETGLPLLGMTIGLDGAWSARFWLESRPGRVAPAHCADVRRVGTRHTRADWHPNAHPPYARRPCLVRTLDSWGIKAQTKLARTHVCVVGAGSVGSIVLEGLARTGFEEITIIDPDLIEDSNLDRLIYADRHCRGLRKAEVAALHVRRISTAHRPLVRPVPLSIRTERAYRLAADADVILCCVDNAEARDVLNHMAYANFLPLIDGGVLVDSCNRLLSAKWRVHLAGPGMRCLRCREQYSSSDARDERIRIRRQGRYIGNGEMDGAEPGQNTIAFRSVVAAEQTRMLVRYLIGEDWWHSSASTAGRWSFEHRFVEAETEPFEHPGKCAESCEFTHARLGLGVAGRPEYPFESEPRENWTSRMMLRYRRIRMKLHRAATIVCT